MTDTSDTPLAPTSGDVPRQSPFALAPESDRLYSLAADGSRKWIDPVPSVGPYVRLRKVMGYALIAFFLAMPHVRVHDKPGILFDLVHRQFTIVGITFHPTDNLILLAFGATVIVGLFALTALWGRLWCGYLCPQPIYLEFVFRPLERLFEGKVSARRRRDQGPWSLERVARKTAKWLGFTVVALFLGATFVSYFVGFEAFVQGLRSEPAAHQAELFTWLFVSALVFFDFAYFRDQMCTVACPYGRLQTVLYDADTVIVGYDTKRGEPRAPKRARDVGQLVGDCVDCGRCIATCPTGMDIRRGLQMECIGCAQCVEACDDVMAKLGRPLKLIRYTSLRELSGAPRRFVRPRLFVYGGILALTSAALTLLVFTRADARAEILRNGREPYRLLVTGEVANQLRLRITNNRPETQTFTVTLVEPKHAELVVSQSPLVVPGDLVGTVELVAKLNEDLFVNGQARGRFEIRSSTGLLLTQTFVLLGPYRAGAGK